MPCSGAKHPQLSQCKVRTEAKLSYSFHRRVLNRSKRPHKGNPNISVSRRSQLAVSAARQLNNFSDGSQGKFIPEATAILPLQTHRGHAQIRYPQTSTTNKGPPKTALSVILSVAQYVLSLPRGTPAKWLGVSIGVLVL